MKKIGPGSFSRRTHMKALLLTVNLGLLLLLAQITTAPSEAQTKSSEIAITPISFAGLNKAIAAQKGKVVVVDVWSTTCIPCIKEFPELVEIHEKYGDKV